MDIPGNIESKYSISIKHWYLTKTPAHDLNWQVWNTTLESLREEMCIYLTQSMQDPNHKVHSLLPDKVEHIRDRITRTSGDRLYNFKCKAERYKNSPIVHATDRYNQNLS